jgi:hypothetical protein
VQYQYFARFRYSPLIIHFPGFFAAIPGHAEVPVVELTGAEIVVQALKDEGVEYVFGYPGGAVLHIYDAIFREDATSRVPRMLRTATPARPGGPASCSSPPGPVRPTR